MKDRNRQSESSKDPPPQSPSLRFAGGGEGQETKLERSVGGDPDSSSRGSTATVAIFIQLNQNDSILGTHPLNPPPNASLEGVKDRHLRPRDGLEGVKESENRGFVRAGYDWDRETVKGFSCVLVLQRPTPSVPLLRAARLHGSSTNASLEGVKIGLAVRNEPS